MWGKVLLPIFILVLWSSLHLGGCGVSEICQKGERVSSLSLNPNQSLCKLDCECNNQDYEGACIKGKCIAFARETCPSKGLRRPCLPVVGECDGFQICYPDYLSSYKWGDCICSGEQHKCVQEVCDGQDNDCDGAIDEGLSRICYDSKAKGCYTSKGKYICKGICQEGIQECVQGVWTSCRGAVYPQGEKCNGLDDDCDGLVDNIPLSSFKGCLTPLAGECRFGRETCQNGQLKCTPLLFPGQKTEICDGKDNDCDGMTDEGLFRKCFAGTKGCRKDEKGNYVCIGPCRAGVQQCQNGHWGACQGMVAPIPEVCGNKKDDNCNGSIDEDCSCSTLGERRECATDKGECQKGVQICLLNQTWSPCMGSNEPQPEICDGKDNDCDGKIDEELEQPCYSLPQICTRSEGKFYCRGVCKVGLKRCLKGKWTECQGEVLPSEEICDGKDNDCNGKIDDLVVSKECNVPNTKEDSRCHKGQTFCQKGKEICKPTLLPIREKCDGKDNNCDGQIDENLTKPCYPAKEKGCRFDGQNYICQGTCRAGRAVCQQGKWGKCQGSVIPEREKCNGKDDDCDGLIDEDCSCEDGRKRFCGTDKGTCQRGIQYCRKGKWSKCEKAVGPTQEICDGLDNNCNGEVDENLTKLCYSQLLKGCTFDKEKKSFRCQGVCRAGISHCIAGQWGPCEDEILPTSEICNGKDDDCNGKIDDNTPSLTCHLMKKGLKGNCAIGKTTCQKGKNICQQTIFPKKETCNGLDDDCDGEIDEDDPKKKHFLCPVGQRCSDGQCVECSLPIPHYCPLTNDFIPSCRSKATCPNCPCRTKCTCHTLPFFSASYCRCQK